MMRHILHIAQFAAWAFVAFVVVYAAVGPGPGALYGNPLACLGVGLIGLGLAVHARRARAKPVPARANDAPD